MTQIPLLVVEKIVKDPADPRRMAAIVRAGGHRLQVILDFSRRERFGIEYVEMPKLLDLHRPSMQAVTRLMERAYEGEAIETPVDLTEQVGQLSPYEAISANERSALEALADDVTLEILDIHGTGADPCNFSARLRVDGREFDMAGEIYTGPDRIPFLSWRNGPEPHGLSKGQCYAIQRALERWKSEQR